MSIVSDFEKAFNRQDVAGLVACFTEGASYRDNFYGEHRGHAALRAMFERMFREGRDYCWVMDTVVEAPDRATAEWTFGYVVTAAVPRSTGRKIGFRRLLLGHGHGGRGARSGDRRVDVRLRRDRRGAAKHRPQDRVQGHEPLRARAREDRELSRILRRGPGTATTGFRDSSRS